MSIVKFNPFVPGFGMNRFIDDVFNRNFSQIVGSDFVINQPSVNVKETETEFQIELAAPGLDKENFSINLEDKHLVVSASKEQKTEAEADKTIRKEFNYASFKRSFQLPENVLAERISAGYEKGVLTISLPKKAVDESDNKRQIEIK